MAFENNTDVMFTLTTCQNIWYICMWFGIYVYEIKHLLIWTNICYNTWKWNITHIYEYIQQQHTHTHTYIHTNVFNGIEMYLNMRFSVLYAKKFPFAHNSVAQTVWKLLSWWSYDSIFTYMSNILDHTTKNHQPSNVVFHIA